MVLRNGGHIVECSVVWFVGVMVVILFVKMESGLRCCDLGRCDVVVLISNYVRDVYDDGKGFGLYIE